MNCDCSTYDEEWLDRGSYWEVIRTCKECGRTWTYKTVSK